MQLDGKATKDYLYLDRVPINRSLVLTFLYFFLSFFFAIKARRPPVEETTSFLNSLLASHGPNYLEKLFGSKARHRLRELGGVNTVAIALSGKEK